MPPDWWPPFVPAPSSASDFPGCQAYLIGHDRADPDTVYVVEIWADEGAAAAALEADQKRGSASNVGKAR